MTDVFRTHAYPGYSLLHAQKWPNTPQMAAQILPFSYDKASVVHANVREQKTHIALRRLRSPILQRMNVGPLTNRKASSGTSHDDPFLVARALGLRLHMRTREGCYIRGNDVWYDRQMSLPQQRAMLATWIERVESSAKLKPMRKSNAIARKRHNVA